jgi:hypothetical protein
MSLNVCARSQWGATCLGVWYTTPVFVSLRSGHYSVYSRLDGPSRRVCSLPSTTLAYYTLAAMSHIADFMACSVFLLLVERKRF